ncbi:FAD/NAD(P)-dependent oxidoreductase [Sphaerisporangium sp. NPDC004334]
MRDLAIVGAGPAGMAAAVAAAQAGLSVVLVDSGARLGGQYFRHAPAGFRARRPGALHHGFGRFAALAAELGRHGVEVRLRRRVWAVERTTDSGRPVTPPATGSGPPVTPPATDAAGDGGVVLHCLAGDREERRESVAARRLLIATGAHDRPLPFPGWDLPGVFTAGGAQALLKGDLVTAGRRVVVAGTGPFLLPVATALAAAGARVAAVLEANGRFGPASAMAGHPGRLAEAAGYGYGLARHRIPYLGRHAVIAAHGDRELTHVTVADLDRDWAPRRRRTIACDALAVGYGFVPQIELAVQLGCATRAGTDGTPVVAVDAGMRTSVPGVYAAGEPTGVGGAELAEVEGRIAGRAAAADLGRRVPPDPGLPARRDRLATFARALQAAYPVRDGWKGWLTDDTLICRCEEVPYARIKQAARLGATDARSMKLLARPGMGWCQGRVCGYAVARLAGEDPGPPRRPVAQPVRLGYLAGDPAEDLGEEPAGDPGGEDPR